MPAVRARPSWGGGALSGMDAQPSKPGKIAKSDTSSFGMMGRSELRLRSDKVTAARIRAGETGISPLPSPSRISPSTIQDLEGRIMTYPLANLETAHPRCA
jgi:hypothetical protein